MLTKLKKIGNSKGITLAKAIMDQYQFQDEIEMEFKKEGILIKPTQVIPREKWEEAYKKLNTLTIVPLTSTLKNYPHRVPCTFQGKSGEVVIEQVRTVDKQRLLNDQGCQMCIVRN